jgi:hypothetical protein
MTIKVASKAPLTARPRTAVTAIRPPRDRRRERLGKEVAVARREFAAEAQSERGVVGDGERDGIEREHGEERAQQLATARRPQAARGADEAECPREAGEAGELGEVRAPLLLIAGTEVARERLERPEQQRLRDD